MARTKEQRNSAEISTISEITAATASTPILRLRLFAQWAREQGFVKGEASFEAKCGLSNRYLYNTTTSTTGHITTDTIQKVADVFPMLNVRWLVLGGGEMIDTSDHTDLDYKNAYEVSQMQIEALHIIIKKLEIRDTKMRLLNGRVVLNN